MFDDSGLDTRLFDSRGEVYEKPTIVEEALTGTLVSGDYISNITVNSRH